MTSSINNKDSGVENKNQDNTKKFNKRPWLGRAINWFQNTSSGRGTGAALRAVGAVAFGAAGLFVAVNSLGLAIFGIMACTTLIGIPLGLICIGFASGGFLLSKHLFQAAWSMGKKADNNVTKAKQLATAEATA